MALKVRTKVNWVNYICKLFSSQYHISLSINYVYTRGKSFSFVYESKLHQTLFQWWFTTPRSNIVVTSCQPSPTGKSPRLEVKPLQINESDQGIFLQLSCPVGSNFSKLFSLVLSLNFVKSRVLKKVCLVFFYYIAMTNAFWKQKACYCYYFFSYTTSILPLLHDVISFLFYLVCLFTGMQEKITKIILHWNLTSSLLLSVLNYKS